MSRLVAEHFREDGRPKQIYETEAEAKRAAYLFNRHPYRCGFCKRWHVGGWQRGWRR